MECQTLADLKTALGPAASLDGTPAMRDASALDATRIDTLAWSAVFSPPDVRDASRFLLREAARARGAYVASIQPFYRARGRGEVRGFTVPAMNIRGLTYEVVRAAYRAASRLEVGCPVFEIARSEIGYTAQRPAEYAACVIAAALREGWRGPVFIQGDHYQANAKAFRKDPQAETDAIRALIEESIPAGFLNIDIDTSTLVDLSLPTVEEQQRLNAELAAEFTRHVRAHEPAGVTISVGGEIGEVGGKNSTPEELRAYMNGYLAALKSGGAAHAPISKISIQTGTTHGGVPLPDGRVAEVKIDFDVLTTLSRIAREEYGMAGAVQHGASTLPEEAFDRFPATETAEIHLATGFQNLVFDHAAFPADLRAEIRAWCEANCAAERKAGMSEEQFLYKTRKKAFGPFKRRLWSLDRSVMGRIMGDLEERFALLYRRLAATGTREIVLRHVPDPGVAAPPPALSSRS